MSFEQIFDSWLASLTFDERSTFLPLSLRSMLSLRQVRIDWDFLGACIHFWDPTFHVFRLGGTEICPLPEEFGAVLGYSEDSPPVTPVLEGDFARDFETFLGLSRQQVGTFLIDGEVDLRLFVSLFFPYTSTSAGALALRCRRRAFLFCLLHRFFFVGERRDRGHASFIAMGEQVLDEHSPAHLIVGETLMCLDRIHVGPHEAFSGSPLLLQIWLQEHLSLIRRPSDPLTYEARSFPSRRRSTSFSSREEWMTYLRGCRSVRYRIGWWRLHSMVGGPARGSYRRLLGLARVTFYTPHRLRRQYGLAQRILATDDTPPAGDSLSTRYVEEWRSYWARSVRWTEPRVRESTYTTDYYQEWASSFDAEKKALLRQLEREEITGRPAPTQGVVFRESREAPPREREVQGKGKRKTTEDGPPSKRWRRDDGSSSGK